MFTGIIEELGEVAAIKTGLEGGTISIKASTVFSDAGIGDSICVNGTCLTVVEISGDTVKMDILSETIQRSTLKFISTGDRVNLERSLTPSSKLGGHFVFGHVDCVGRVQSVSKVGRDWRYDLAVDADLLPYLAVKGSVAIDGISLTITNVGQSGFAVNVIPHTYESTTLKYRKAGSSMNVEVDMLARYVHRVLSTMQGQAQGVTEAYLREKGMI